MAGEGCGRRSRECVYAEAGSVRGRARGDGDGGHLMYRDRAFGGVVLVCSYHFDRYPLAGEEVV